MKLLLIFFCVLNIATGQELLRSVSYHFVTQGNAQPVKPAKSKLLAIGLSSIIPGTGQFYIGSSRSSFIRGSVYGALEVTSWLLYFHNRSSGLDQRHQFEKYANSNWDVDKYLSFLESTLNLTSGELGRNNSGINYAELESAESAWGGGTGVSVHHLFKSGRQQYYEMIYKYPEQFAQGWSDADPGLVDENGNTGYTFRTLTPAMKHYRSMRNQSNAYYDQARTMLSVMLVNRIFSVMDVVITNRKGKSTAYNFRLQPFLGGTNLSVVPTIQVQF